jgi:hypothetical protein
MLAATIFLAVVLILSIEKALTRNESVTKTPVLIKRDKDN